VAIRQFDNGRRDRKKGREREKMRMEENPVILKSC
jgi:hypothetical protein